MKSLHESSAWPDLGCCLLDRNVLTADWIPAFSHVRRAAFLPDVIWPYDTGTCGSFLVDRARDPREWHAYADANVPIVTQWDDGRRHGDRTAGEESTSSASMPSVVFAMLRDLQALPGDRVLEIGTGTGWNAALLAHRLGAENVTSVEVDPDVADAARRSLGRFGLPVDVVTADGTAGAPHRAPYDRIIATCGVRELPYAWVEQTRPGGTVLAPWGTCHGTMDATVRLVVSDDGRSAAGRFLEPVEFMKLRSQRPAWPRHADYVPADGHGAERSTTTITEKAFGTGRFDDAHFAVGLQVRDCVRSVAQERDGRRPVWLYSLTDRSWAVVVFRDDGQDAVVHQAGARALWDEVEAAWHWWDLSGRPGIGRFGLTVSPEGQTAWLDSPDHPVPVVG